MIEDREAIRLIHNACEEIEADWREHLAFWEGEEAGEYNEVAVFAHYVVDRYGEGKTGDFEAIFNTVERIIVEGSESAQGLAIVGFLEGVQNISSHRPFGKSVFEPWFGPQSIGAWLWLHELWRGHSTLADVIRSVRGTSGSGTSSAEEGATSLGKQWSRL